MANLLLLLLSLLFPAPPLFGIKKAPLLFSTGSVAVLFFSTGYCVCNIHWQSSNLAVQNGFISRGSSGPPELFRVAVQLRVRFAAKT